MKPEVELMVFLLMRSNKITKHAEKRHHNEVWRPNFPLVHVFWHEESEFAVRFETGTSINGASAHAQ